MNTNLASQKGILIIISSPSGAGKTTLTRKLVSDLNDAVLSISVTTRKKRDNEEEGLHYFFINDEVFNQMVKDGELLEYASVFGFNYGTPKERVIKNIEIGKNVIFDIDWQGTEQIKNKKLHYKLITFFILPPSKKVLFERSSNRDMKDKLIVEERMKQFGRDVLHWINYDYVVINDDLNNCYTKIVNLIDAEINNGSKDYDLEFVRNHIEKLTS